MIWWRSRRRSLPKSYFSNQCPLLDPRPYRSCTIWPEVQSWLGVGDERWSMSAPPCRQRKSQSIFVALHQHGPWSKRIKNCNMTQKLLRVTEVGRKKMAQYGHIRYQEFSPHRPDGSKWTTVLDLCKEWLQIIWVRVAYGWPTQFLSNPYQLVSEQWIAKRLFRTVKASPCSLCSHDEPWIYSHRGI